MDWLDVEEVREIRNLQFTSISMLMAFLFSER